MYPIIKTVYEIQNALNHGILEQQRQQNLSLDVLAKHISLGVSLNGLAFRGESNKKEKKKTNWTALQSNRRRKTLCYLYSFIHLLFVWANEVQMYSLKDTNFVKCNHELQIIIIVSVYLHFGMGYRFAIWISYQNWLAISFKMLTIQKNSISKLHLPISKVHFFCVASRKLTQATPTHNG